MKTSARNYFQGYIAQITNGAVNDEVALKLESGTIVTAIITHESTERLGLKVREKAFALIKASSIIVATDMQKFKLSTRNCLTGKVSKVTPGAVNSEVCIDLGSGVILAAIITNESCQSLGLKAGDEATALFKASSVILGTGA